MILTLLKAQPPSIVRQWAENQAAPKEVYGERALAPAGDEDTALRISQLSAAIKNQGQHPAERYLLESSTGWVNEDPPQAYDSANGVFIIGLDDDSDEGFFKPLVGVNDDTAEEYGHTSPMEQLAHEAAAWQLAREMGSPWDRIVVPCVLREIGNADDGLGIGSFTRAVELADMNATFRTRESDPDEINAGAFFDALTGAQDRNSGNLIVGKEGLRLIDHGYSFGRTGDICTSSRLVERRAHAANSFMPALTTDETNALRKLVDSPDLHGIESIIGTERADCLRKRAEVMLRHGLMVPEGFL